MNKNIQISTLKSQGAVSYTHLDVYKRQGNAASGNTASGDAGPGYAAYGAAPAAEAAGAFSSDQAAPAMTDAADETMASDTAGAAGAGEGPAVSETASEKDMPISPLTGARTREYRQVVL